MFLLSKLAVSSIMALSAGGASLYLIPVSLGKALGLPQQMYDYSISEQERFDISSLIELSEKNINEVLKPLLDNLEQALKFSTKRKDQEQLKIDEFLQKVKESEERIKKLYEENVQNLKELDERLRELGISSSISMKRDSIHKGAENFKKLIEGFKEKLGSWGSSLEGLLCVLEGDNKSSEKDSSSSCTNNSEELKKKFEERRQENGKASTTVVTKSSSESQTEGRKASSQLQTSKEELLKMQFSLSQWYKFFDDMSKFWDYFEKRSNLSLLFSNYVKSILELEIKQIREKIKTKSEKSKKEGDSLNKRYQELRDSNSKWEIFKKLEDEFYKYWKKVYKDICSKSSLERNGDSFCIEERN